MNLRDRLQNWVTWPVAHPWRAIGAMGVLAALAGLCTTRLKANGSLAAMFPRGDPSADALVHVLNDFPAADQLLVLASVPGSSSKPQPRELEEFGRRLVERIRQTPDIDRLTDGVFFAPDADSRNFVEQVIGPSAMFYLDDASFEAARRRLTRQEIYRQIEQDKAVLSAPGPAADAMSKMVRIDPLRLHEFITDRLAGQRPFRTYPGSDAFVSPDGKSLLVRVIGRRPPSDLDYSRALTAGVRQAAEAVNRDHLTLEFTGSYAIAAASERAIRRDMIGSIVGSVVLLQILFLVAYRSPFKLFALAFGPVALGILLGFGAYATVSPGLTPLTAVLGAILAGMGIDYSVQYLSFYESRRSGGSPAPRAAAQTAREMSPAVLAAWATSVIGFVAVGWSHVQALRDFAVLGILGLTGSFLCALLLLPALLMLTDKRPQDAPRSRIRFGTARLLSVVARRRGTWIGLSLTAMVGAAIFVARSGGDVLPMESDLTVMHPRPNPAIDAEYHVAERFGISSGSFIVYLHTDDPARLVPLAYDVNARLQTPEARAGGVTGTYGLATLLPDPRLAPARTDPAAAAEADRVVADFRSALDDNGFDPAAFDGYAKFLRLLLTRRSVPTPADLYAYRHLAETVLPASGGAPTEAITLVFVRQPLDRDRAARDAAIAAVRGALRGVRGARVTGLGVVAHDTEQVVRRELPRLILAAVLLAGVYLVVHFRSAADVLLALLPAVFGMVVAAAVLRAAGERLNMINLVAVPLLIGIDVDYGIFLVSLTRFRRVRGQDSHELARRIDPVCHAVIVCATATVLGYVSLIWTSVPAERSLGIAAAVGIGACLAGVLFLLVPLFFSLCRRK